MKRMLTFILAAATTLALAGCGADGGKEQPASTMSPKQAQEMVNPALEEKMASPKQAHKDEYFDMQLHVAQTAFKAGEPIEISASLTYIGEDKSYTVWGPRGAQVVLR